MKIPDRLFDKYYEAADEFINSKFIGVDCTVVYPPKKIKDESLSTNYQGVVTNKTIHGGPAPFSQNNLSGGNNIKEIEVTEPIRLRVYHDQKSWKKIVDIQIPDADVMVIGFMDDMSKVLRSQYIILTNNKNLDHRYSLAKDPFPHGFGKNRYFIAFLKKI